MLRVLLLTFVVAFAVILPPGPAAASHTGYHYAAQWTATSLGVGLYHPTSSPPCNHPGCSAYYGWIGIYARVTTPGSVPYVNEPYKSHVNSNITMLFNNGGWLQTGWMSGTGGICPNFETCADYPDGVGRYVETRNGSQFLLAWEQGSLPLGGSMQYWIEYVSAQNCWKVLQNSVQVIQVCNQPAFGAAYAGAEVYDDSDGGLPAIQMPQTVYGNSNPNSPSAVRIKGASGFQPWDSTLTSYTTRRYDERFSTPDYWISHISLYYYFLTADY